MVFYYVAGVRLRVQTGCVYFVSLFREKPNFSRRDKVCFEVDSYPVTFCNSSRVFPTDIRGSSGLWCDAFCIIMCLSMWVFDSTFSRAGLTESTSWSAVSSSGGTIKDIPLCATI